MSAQYLGIMGEHGRGKGHHSPGGAPPFESSFKDETLGEGEVML